MFSCSMAPDPFTRDFFASHNNTVGTSEYTAFLWHLMPERRQLWRPLSLDGINGLKMKYIDYSSLKGKERGGSVRARERALYQYQVHIYRTHWVSPYLLSQSRYGSTKQHVLRLGVERA